MERNMSRNYTLYYPTVEFRNPYWLWSASLVWDRIYRIVPENYKPNDSDNIRKLIEDGDIVTAINPKEYAEKAIDSFMDYLNVKEKAWAAALDNSFYTNKEYVELHKDKADVKIREMILAEEKEDSDWLNVPHDMASIYMLYLAGYIAEKYNVSLSTDYAEAWCGSNFFQYEGNLNDNDVEEPTTALTAITIGKIIPNNIMNLTPEELIKFRNNSTDERRQFFQCIRELGTEISNCSDANGITDIINDHIKDLERSKREYRKRMLDIKATGFIGLKSIMVPAVVSVLSSFTELPDTLTKKMQAIGVGIGAIGGFWEYEKSVSKERKNFECNYLMQLSEHVPPEYYKYFETDKNNIYEGYQQYLANNLNHFLRD
jgi:hypothetical protein